MVVNLINDGKSNKTGWWANFWTGDDAESSRGELRTRLEMALASPSAAWAQATPPCIATHRVEAQSHPDVLPDTMHSSFSLYRTCTETMLETKASASLPLPPLQSRSPPFHLSCRRPALSMGSEGLERSILPSGTEFTCSWVREGSRYIGFWVETSDPRKAAGLVEVARRGVRPVMQDYDYNDMRE